MALLSTLLLFKGAPGPGVQEARAHTPDALGLLRAPHPARGRFPAKADRSVREPPNDKAQLLDGLVSVPSRDQPELRRL